MNPLLADPPASADQVRPPVSEPPATAAQEQSSAPRRDCKSCGATLIDGQDWCLRCGAGAPGSLGEKPDWRPLATIAAAAAILLGGAGAAAYAALSQPVHKSPLHVAIATVPPPTASTPSTPLPGASTPTTTTPPVSGVHGLPPISTKPLKIPSHTPTPTPGPSSTGGSTTTTTTTTSTTNTTTGANAPAAQTPNPIVLDTNAASTYNPYNYPAETFGDPSLAIDGETATGWTANVDPTVAPRMAEGIVIDLRSARRLGSLEVNTTTPGASIEVYGANGQEPPPAITDSGWTKLNPGHVLKKRKATLKLHAGSASYRFIVVWLTKAPAGVKRVSINELSLFPPTPAK